MKVRLLKIMDATVGFTLCWMGGYLLHLLRRNVPAEMPRTGSIQRILVIRPGGMGDMILLQPMLQSLRRNIPGVVIDLVCERRNREIPALAGDGAGLLLYDASPLKCLFRLLRGGYDVAIDTEQFHYFSAVMALLSRAPVRIGFKINPGRNQIYTHLVNYDLEGYEAGEFMRLLGPLGISEPAVVPGCIQRTASSAKATAAMEDRGQRTEDGDQRSGVSQDAILVHVGASTRYKHWDEENFVALLKGLAACFPACIALIGGNEDRDKAQRIATESGLGDRVTVLAGRQTLVQVAAVIGRASLFVGGDSGLAHLAVALNVPTVVMFGPSDDRKWGVRGERHAVVRKGLACSPCFIFGYHKFCRSIACMKGIDVESVLSACKSVKS